MKRLPVSVESKDAAFAAGAQKAENKAIKINAISLKYHLSHATFACNIEIEEIRKAMLSSAMEEVKGKISKALGEHDANEHRRLLREQKEIADTFDKLRIYVDYYKGQNKGAYTFLDKETLQLVIWLPSQLLKDSFVDGAYTPQVKELRELVAHELGHAVLHTEKLINMTEYGSKGFKDDSQEEHEARAFGAKLMSLRHERNVKMREDGTGELYF